MNSVATSSPGVNAVVTISGCRGDSAPRSDWLCNTSRHPPCLTKPGCSWAPTLPISGGSIPPTEEGFIQGVRWACGSLPSSWGHPGRGGSWPMCSGGEEALGRLSNVCTYITQKHTHTHAHRSTHTPSILTHPQQGQTSLHMSPCHHLSRHMSTLHGSLGPLPESLSWGPASVSVAAVRGEAPEPCRKEISPGTGSLMEGTDEE